MLPIVCDYSAHSTDVVPEYKAGCRSDGLLQHLGIFTLDAERSLRLHSWSIFDSH